MYARLVRDKYSVWFQNLITDCIEADKYLL